MEYWHSKWWLNPLCMTFPSPYLTFVFFSFLSRNFFPSQAFTCQAFTTDSVHASFLLCLCYPCGYSLAVLSVRSHFHIQGGREEWMLRRILFEALDAAKHMLMVPQVWNSSGPGSHCVTCFFCCDLLRFSCPVCKQGLAVYKLSQILRSCTEAPPKSQLKPLFFHLLADSSTSF